jgi:hypothetical protein
MKTKVNTKKKVSTKPKSKALKQGAVSSSSKMNGYHIETLDGTGSFNFFTEAENHKKALRNLETKSFDYRRLVKTDKDLTITVKKVY